MTRRPVLLGLLVWVAVVAVASAITWTVIDSAGEQALFDAGQLPPLPQASGAAASPSSSPRSGAPSPTAPRPSDDGTPSGPRTSPPAGPSGSAPPAYTERSWQGAAGVVVARCTGSAISLRSATPSDAYRVEVGSRGPEEVEVKFDSGDREVKVRAECAGGAPSFRQGGGESSED